MADNIRIQLILEVLGKPQEYVKEILEKLREEIGKENGVNLISFSIAEPREIKDNNEFFTGFLDLEVEVEKVDILFALCFKYMPAHIDLIYPEKLNLTNSQLSELVNYLVTRLHGYDEIARILQLENEKLGKELESFKNVEKKD